MIKRSAVLILLVILSCLMLFSCSTSEQSSPIDEEKIKKNISEIYGNDNITILGPDEIGGDELW